VINNQWAISVPRNKQNSAKTLAQKGIAGDLPSVQVDGNDIIACHWAMENALERARRGDGPGLIEMMTYRLADHTTADDSRRYRDDEEVENAWQAEPVKRLGTYLRRQGAWDDEKESTLLDQAGKEVEQAVKEYRSVGEPGIGSMFDHLYANMPAELEAQRASAVAEQD
jgi:pyruvate dehydrogenase E1 component alpha subunit